MKTDPKSLHDAMRRLQVVLSGARIDLANYIDTDQKVDELGHVLDALRDAQAVVGWVRETFESGVRR